MKHVYYYIEYYNVDVVVVQVEQGEGELPSSGTIPCPTEKSCTIKAPDHPRPVTRLYSLIGVVCTHVWRQEHVLEKTRVYTSVCSKSESRRDSGVSLGWVYAHLID